MSKFNENIEYTDRLRENMREIPFSIYQHLIEEDNILRPRQKVAITDLVESIFAGNRASLMWMPTGGGKTVMLARMLEGFHRDAETQRLKRTLFISDSKEGVRNTAEKIKKFSGVNATVFYGPEKNLSGEVIVTTYKSWQGGNFPVDPLEFDLVVLDEGHKSLSKARRAELHKYKNALWLPLTATPKFSEAKYLLEYYALGHRTTIPEAVQTGLISSFRNIVLKTNINVNLQEIALAYDGEFSQSALETEINKKARNYAVAEYLLFGQHPDTGENIRELRGIVGCCSVEHAKDHASVLNEAYKKFFPDSPEDYRFAAHIHGTMPDKQRDKILQDHRAGKIGYLTYADLLIHNYDDPGIQVTVNSRLTLSHVVIQQSHGRGLRIDDNNPGKIALCIDVLDNYIGEQSNVPLVYGASIGTTSEITEEVKKKVQLKKFKSDRKYVVNKTDGAVLAALVKSLSLKVTVDQEEIFSLIRDMQELGLPDKTEGDLTYGDFEKLGFSLPSVSRALLKLFTEQEKYEDLRASGESDENNPAPPVFVYKVKSSMGQSVFAIKNDPENIEYFKQYVLGSVYGLPDKTKNDLTVGDLKKLGLSSSSASKVLLKLFKAREKYEDLRASGEPDENNPVPPVFVYKIKPLTGGIPAFAIKNDPENIERFKRYALGDTYGLQFLDKTEDDATAGDFENLGLSSVSEALLKLFKAWKKYEDLRAKGEPDENNPVPPVFVYKVKPPKGPPACAIKNDPENIERFKRYVSGSNYALSDKTKDDLTTGDLKKLGLPSVSKSLSDLFTARVNYEDFRTKGEPDENNPVPPVFVYKVKPPKGGAGFAIKNDPENIERFKRYALGDTYGLQLPDKTEDDVTYGDFANLGLPSVPGLSSVSRALLKLFTARKEYEDLRAKGGPDADNPAPPVFVYKVKPPKGPPAYAIKNDPENIKAFLTFMTEKEHLLDKKSNQPGRDAPVPV